MCLTECDYEASIMRRPLPTRGCCAMGGGVGNLLQVINCLRVIPIYGHCCLFHFKPIKHPLII